MSTICFDARMYSHSGIGRYVQNILPFLAEHFELSALKSRSHGFNENPNIQTIALNADIYTIEEQLLFFSKVPQTDIFWSPHYNIPLLPLKAKKRIVTIHDVFHLAMPQGLGTAQKIYASAVMKAATSFSDTILTVSEFSKTEIVKHTGVDSAKVHVVHNGIEHRFFNTEPVSKEQAPISNHISKPFILYVGNIKPHKNLKILIEAFEKLNIVPGLQLVLAGQKEGFITPDTQLLQKIHNNENILIIGKTTDIELKYLYQNAEVFVFPSVYEGFGFPPLEAMACGCPVISSNATSLPEICGNAVLYFSPHNADELCEKLLTMCYNMQKRQELVQLGIAQAAKFSWEQHFQKLLTIIENP